MLFGEIDPHIELAYELAFREMATLLKELKSDADLAPQFASLEVGSEEFADFVRNVAFDHAGRFRRAFNAGRRDKHLKVSVL